MNTQTQQSQVELDDLDSLLSESVELADARRQAKKGGKLTQDQIELLDANKLAEEMQLWQDVAMFAHLTESLCDCGNCFKDFNGWYKLQRRRGKQSERLIKVDETDSSLESKQYLTYALVSHCYECVEDTLEHADADDCALLTSLGSSVKPWYEPTEEEAEDLLNELTGELEDDAN